jgi:hypothetical protein
MGTKASVPRGCRPKKEGHCVGYTAYALLVRTITYFDFLDTLLEGV